MDNYNSHFQLEKKYDPDLLKKKNHDPHQDMNKKMTHP